MESSMDENSLDQSSLDLPETPSERVLKKVFLYLISVFFLFTGLRHLVFPDFYVGLMPSFIPVPYALIFITGILQIICAIGLVILKTRKVAAYGLLFFLVATLPILVYLWVYKESMPTGDLPSWLLLLSVPLQFALIFWVYLFAKRPESY